MGWSLLPYSRPPVPTPFLLPGESPSALAFQHSEVACVRMVPGFLKTLELCLWARSVRSFLARARTGLVSGCGTLSKQARRERGDKEGLASISEGEWQGTSLPRPGKAAQGSFGLKGVWEGERLRSIWRRGSHGVHRIAKPA